MGTTEAYLRKLTELIREVHNCSSRHIGSVAVKEKLRGSVVWEGEVEVFELVHHPSATHCFAWDHSRGNGEMPGKYVVTLNVPPVQLPQDAVRVYLSKK